MYSPGSETYGNGVESARKAGYAGCYNVLAQIAHKLVNNGKIQLAKKQIQADNAEIVDCSRDKCLEVTYNIMLNSESEANQLKAVSLIGDFAGYKRELAPNAAKEALRAIKGKEVNGLLQAFVRDYTARKSKIIESEASDNE